MKHKSFYTYMAAVAIMGVIGIKLYSNSPIIVQSNDITLANINAILGLENDAEEGGEGNTEKGDGDTEKGNSDTEKGNTDTEKGDTDTEKGSSRTCKRIVSSHNCVFASGANKGLWCSLAIKEVESYTVKSYAESCHQYAVKPCDSGCVKKTI